LQWSFFEMGAFGTVAYGTSNGVLIPDGGLGVGWKVLLTGLPKVTTIMDMVYDETDDLLVVATFWTWHLVFGTYKFFSKGDPNTWQCCVKQFHTESLWMTVVLVVVVVVMYWCLW
jgi:hypothetical protein